MASFKKLAAAFTLAAAGLTLVVGADYTYNMAYNYAEGSRTGTIFKLSKKGGLCKTWEGEMMMDGIGLNDGQGVTASFQFTVMDEKLLPKIEDEKNKGERVELKYRQAKWLWSCLQESEYVATAVNKIEPASAHNLPLVITMPQQYPKK
ncbi:MAG: hypothetical protein EPN97_18050 [Alphaproteobacteria bacterium]|nr:MAG: hypothetical protein EPN97_18050 [Alphaproteobacteria bacterium]